MPLRVPKRLLDHLMLLTKNETFTPTWDKFLVFLGLLGLLLSSYLLVQNIDVVEVQQGQVEAGSIELRNTARRRHTRSFVWETLSGTAKVYWLDTIYVPPGNTAELEILGNVISLESDSMIQIDAIYKDRVEISLIDGRVRKKKEVTNLSINGKRQVGKKSMIERVVAKPAVETKAWIDFSPELTISEVKPYEDEWNQLNERLKQILESKPERVAIKKTGEALLAINDPSHYTLQLLSPPAGIFTVKRGESVRFQWGKFPIKDMKYRLEVRQLTQPQPQVFETANGSYAVRLLYGNYRWRVTAFHKGKQLATEEGNFTLLGKSKTWEKDEEWNPDAESGAE
jgi:hypothetical protein